MIYILTLAFIVSDFLTGYLKALFKKEVKSKKLREGLMHKGGFVLAIYLSLLIDYTQKIVDLGFNAEISKATCCYIILTEIVSMKENIVQLNDHAKLGGK